VQRLRNVAVLKSKKTLSRKKTTPKKFTAKSAQNDPKNTPKTSLFRTVYCGLPAKSLGNFEKKSLVLLFKKRVFEKSQKNAQNGHFWQKNTLGTSANRTVYCGLFSAMLQCKIPAKRFYGQTTQYTLRRLPRTVQCGTRAM
jgi:hypothetical protein